MTTTYEERGGAFVHPGGVTRTITTEHAAATIVIGALLFLILVRRGFRGVNMPGLGGARIG